MQSWEPRPQRRVGVPLPALQPPGAAGPQALAPTQDGSLGARHPHDGCWGLLAESCGDGDQCHHPWGMGPGWVPAAPIAAHGGHPAGAGGDRHTCAVVSRAGRCGPGEAGGRGQPPGLCCTCGGLRGVGPVVAVHPGHGGCGAAGAEAGQALTGHSCPPPHRDPAGAQGGSPQAVENQAALLSWGLLRPPFPGGFAGAPLAPAWGWLWEAPHCGKCQHLPGLLCRSPGVQLLRQRLQTGDKGGRCPGGGLSPFLPDPVPGCLCGSGNVCGAEAPGRAPQLGVSKPFGKPPPAGAVSVQYSVPLMVCLAQEEGPAPPSTALTQPHVPWACLAVL